MPNPDGHPETLRPIPRIGDQALSRKVYGAKVSVELAEALENIGDRGSWIRETFREKLLLRGLLKNDNWEAIYESLYEVLQAMPIEERVAWMQQKLTEAAIADGLIEPDESPPLE